MAVLNEGLAPLKQILCDIGMSLADREYVAHRWASEVEALRQRPGAQAASEPIETAPRGQDLIDLREVDSVLAQVLIDISDWEDTALAEAVESARDKLQRVRNRLLPKLVVGASVPLRAYLSPLAAPSTGGAETAEPVAYRRVVRRSSGKPYYSYTETRISEDDEPLCLAASSAPAQAVETAGVPEGWEIVMVPKLQPSDEPNWDECIRQAEVATGLKVERHTLSIVIREVRRWLAGRAVLQSPAASPASKEQ